LARLSWAAVVTARGGGQPHNVWVRVAVIPPLDPANPYQARLYGQLEAHGVTIEQPGGLRAGWVRRAAGRVDLVHLHWLEFLYAAEGPPARRAVLAHRRALRALAGMGALGAGPLAAVWTVHNLEPHERPHPWLDRAMAAAALRAADALIVHSRHAEARLRERHARLPEVAVIPHGHYVGAYPPPRAPREAVRARLGVAPDACVLLLFGQVRAYKRVPEAIRAFRAAAVTRAHLVVAGACRDPGLRTAIEAAAAGAGDVTLRLAFVPDEEVAELHLAADGALLYYDDVVSSGALLLALSLGLPVLAPPGTTATELAPPPAVEPLGPDGLAGALRRLAAGDPVAARAAALAAARRADWGPIADATLATYERALAHRGARRTRPRRGLD
jgi:glycosyltransferase involved in cell wall biosynthesis